MTAKRKAHPGLHHHQSVSYDTTKRLSFGQGSSEKYHQHAQDLARNGKYQEAIDVLKEALLQKDAVEANYVKIMDSRSAIHCKMGRYKEAVSDAKCIISAEGQNEKGYLRAGKALLLDGRPEDALEVYRYGLNALAKNNPQRECYDAYFKDLARLYQKPA
ncbi:hypothetical protein UA08_06190 [Talaromyces atroroseus]|uniref:Bacterial transcriptional activator domain-containing protein n=1 Tax=Talaromyces atroroseus TaxID=1441469 RepID=A0A225AUL3_TALAT|nr:hypothetical protein UA08_06190 [Talaromyces atroroseus]OKL58636.1 hypothetical protein UA08_06190 [Talaromyces atroroseus]